MGHHLEDRTPMAEWTVRRISAPRLDFGNGSELWSLDGGIVQLRDDDIETGKWATRSLLEAYLKIAEGVEAVPIDDPQQPACLAIKQCMQGKPGFLGSGYHSAAIKETVRCGCRYCSAVCEITTDSIVRDIRIGYWKDTLSVTFDEFRGDGTSTNTVRTKLFVLDAQEDPVLPVWTDLPGNTASRQSFENIKRWLDTCLTTHNSLCSTSRKPHDRIKLPDRVIEVSVDTPRRIRLIEAKGLSGHYACLSHCWGGQQPLQTTRKPDTLSFHLQHIPETAMPRTFRDAITVMLELGIHYIWIDSLCIIQDDETDWQNQSAQMADIYANSTITIAASASSGPNSGLFRLADSKYVGRPLSSAPGFHMRHPIGHGGRDFPLLQRGWAFQERILSPRILHFAEHELIWECMEYEDCECGSMRLDSLNSPGEYTGGYFQKTLDGEWPATKSHCHPERWRSLKDDREKIAGSWSRLIRNFSELKLSKPNDIFPAISGIAKSFREATGWEYVAGMWKEGLIQNLSWYTQRPALRCKIWRAPTFSWASLQFPKEDHHRDCIAYAHMKDIQELATVVETKCSPKGGDPTGQLESAYIILSGTMIQATVDEYWIKPLQPSSQSIEPLTSSETHDISSTKISSITSRNRENFRFHPDFNHRMEPGATVHCLKLLEATWEGKNAAYLVLSKKSSTPWECDGMRGECEFERLGLMESPLQKNHFHPKVFEEESPEHAIQHNAVVKIV